MVDGTITGSVYEVRLRENVPRVEERIARARDSSGRPEPVSLVAVTKGHPADAARAAVAVGLRICGENRVQELEEKRAAVEAPVEWHLVGHLQRNKARQALPLFELIHSVDSLRLAATLSAEAVRAGVEVAALIQVNASGEATKGGFDVRDGEEAVAQVAALPGLRILGLMTMAPLTADGALIRSTFRSARALFDRCAGLSGFEARHLSMGMSNDFEVAVEEGSTMVRLGTLLFGERER